MKVLVIATKYKHHSKSGGYIQLARFLRPKFLIGIDETKERLPPYFMRAYKWLYEFLAFFKYGNRADLVHIYYGEEYFRFSTFLFRKTPVIVTFHQPASRLKYEIEKGGTGGRIARFTHRITKNRFKNIAAAIVMEETQKEILKRIIPEKKIKVIYHGIDLDLYNVKNQDKVDSIEKNQIITIGNWLRDWDFYAKVLEYSEIHRPSWRFVLINRSISPSDLKRFNKHSNFQYKPDLNDSELFRIIQTSKLHFLPLSEATANNAIIESLAIGCPVILPSIFSSQYQLKCDSLFFYSKGNLEDVLLKIEKLIELDLNKYETLVKDGFKKIQNFDWPKIAVQTQALYNKVKDTEISSRY